MENKTYFRDVETGQVFDVIEQNAELFQEEYENPANLICVDVWYCDGSGFNGRTSGYVYGKTKEEMKVVTDPAEKTNNEMEYAAVIACLSVCQRGDIIKTDSQLVHGQLVKDWKINHEHLRILNETAAVLMREKEALIQWIPRNENIAGEMFQ